MAFLFLENEDFITFSTLEYFSTSYSFTYDFSKHSQPQTQEY